MTLDAPSEVHRQAVGLNGGDRGVVGPLKGYHHETYAFPLPPENELSARFARGKLRVPRPGLFWFDRRCFAAEDRLLMALHGRIQRIPEVVEIDGNVLLQGFVEGRTLGAGPLSSRLLSPHHVSQLGIFFAELVSVKPDELRIDRVCAHEDRPADGDTAGFLRRLVHFTEHEVYGRHRQRYGPLFDALGISGTAGFERLRERADRLRERPFVLVHGDLHRRNFVVDTDGDLWVIDWELAMIGDPLYDLATHLHLMRYPAREEARIRAVWRAAVEKARPGSAEGWQDDLPVLLAYKRVQSVYTDVIRAALTLGLGPEPNWRLLPLVAWRIHRVLAVAREPLGLAAAPTYRQVMAAYRHWLRTAAPDRITSYAS